jgi:hypothetical protein
MFRLDLENWTAILWNMEYTFVDCRWVTKWTYYKQTFAAFTLAFVNGYYGTLSEVEFVEYKNVEIQIIIDVHYPELA